MVELNRDIFALVYSCITFYNTVGGFLKGVCITLFLYGLCFYMLRNDYEAVIRNVFGLDIITGAWTLQYGAHIWVRFWNSYRMSSWIRLKPERKNLGCIGTLVM